ncbi:hypothetical protein SLEP1_g17554 [Rubroshorea leprosula]|uniref:RNase H type-1 domain-containing protein n=1 Tax=Rubroshorea leprosula TaxID=152421 RepID=A0AAV5IUM6_9ROSI|nr:hypothetical protein SLEP1_g17554 [Rubroshorea leprosula]
MPQFESYDGTKDLDDHLHAFYSVMQAQNASDALINIICNEVLKSTTDKKDDLRAYAVDFDGVIMPHNDPLVTSVIVNNCEVQRVLVDTRNALDIMYYHCFESLGLDPTFLQKYDGPIYGFNNQLVSVEGVLKLNFKSDICHSLSSVFGRVSVEGVLKLNVVFSSGRTYVTPLVRFLVVKMASSFNIIIERPTLTEIRAIVSQSHLCMKFLTPMGVVTLKGNQEVMGVELPDNKLEDDARATPAKEVEEVQLDDSDPTKKTVDYCKWVANLVLVKKSNGKWRMCIDYTNLNEAYSRDCHPLPSIDKLVEATSGNERLSLLDAYSGYHQVHMAPEDEVKTSFYIGRNLEVYVDDIVVKSLKAEDHLTDLAETFNNLRRHKMRLNLAKCVFDVEFGKFLGFIVFGRGIEVNPKKIKAIEEMKPPRSIKDLQRLVGRVGALHRPECSGRLIKWAVELGEFHITFQQRSSIQAQALVDFVVECTPSHDSGNSEAELWTLYVDGSSSKKGSGARAVLMGSDNFRSEHALKFNFEATNNMAEYEALLLELRLAAKLKVRSLQAYSDSQLIVNQVNSTCEVIDSTLAKYLVVVSKLKCQFERFQLTKVPRTENEHVDFLSKLASDSSKGGRQILSRPTSEMELSQMTSKTKQSCGEKHLGTPCLMESCTKRSYSLPLLRCLIPYEAEYDLREMHEGIRGSHIGAWTLAHKVLRQGYYWPNMQEDAKKYVQRCQKCQFFAHLTHMPVKELTNLVALWPFAQ